MQHYKLLLTVPLFISVILISCVKPVKSAVNTSAKVADTININKPLIGKAEEDALQFIAQKIIADNKDLDPALANTLKPENTEEGTEIGICGNSYIFEKGNGKYLKGDLNNDNISDLIIRASQTYGATGETSVYFLFLGDGKGYTFCDEFEASKIVEQNCTEENLEYGRFYLDTIKNGFLVGSATYHGGEEEFYYDYSYERKIEKYRFSVNKKKLQLVYKSDLMKYNVKTEKWEKASQNI